VDGHVVARLDWEQSNRKKGEMKTPTSWNSFEVHLRNVDTKRQTETQRRPFFESNWIRDDRRRSKLMQQGIGDQVEGRKVRVRAHFNEPSASFL